MAFKRNDVIRISNAFECSQKDVQSALYAATAYLKASTANTYTVARSISIVIDKLQKSQVKETILYPTFSMKHPAIKKYNSEIVELYYSTLATQNQGWGFIASEIKRLHNIKISRQTIRLYVLRYEEWKLWQT